MSQSSNNTKVKVKNAKVLNSEKNNQQFNSMSCILDGRLRKRPFKVFKVMQPPRYSMCRMLATDLVDNLFNRGDYKDNKIQVV